MKVRLKSLLVDRGKCLYLPDEEARVLIQTVSIPVSQVLRGPRPEPAAVISGEDVEEMLERGYTRQGFEFWIQSCRECQRCIPIRIPVHRFVPSRSQKRTWRRNRDLTVQITNPGLTDEVYDLICDHRLKFGYPSVLPRERYQGTWDGLGGRALEFHYRLGKRLVGLGLVDPTPRAAASLEFFHVMDPRRNLGTYSVLYEIEWARQSYRDYLYLGPLVRECTYMNYKAAFRPHELLAPGAGWHWYQPS